jgi:glycine/D-amino acid oxidase-like deaminating enzyme
MESEPLACDGSADFVIVGGGFTGLWTAVFLKQLDRRADVVLIEQGTVGYGASGRNAGMITNCIDHSHSLAVSHFGWQEAERLAQLGMRNIEEMQSFAQDCDFERTGQLHFALAESHREHLDHEAKIATSLGIGGYRVLSAEEARAELNSPLYKGALFVPGAGLIDPVKLVDKLKREAIALGVRFYERTKVIDFEDGNVRTGSGNITAGKVILATDAYTHKLMPDLLWHYIPLYDYILVSDQLSEKLLSEIGWQNRQGALDCRTFFNYYRLTADNRILWGTSEAAYYPPNRVDEACDFSSSHFEDLKSSFARTFPQLAGMNFPFAWGGPIASTTRLTPFFGSRDNGRTLYALGYTGHGLGSTRVAGKILAHMAACRPSELTHLKMVTKKPFPYPPEPVRSLAVKAVTRSLRDTDNGKGPNVVLKLLDALGIGFSS